MISVRVYRIESLQKNQRKKNVFCKSCHQESTTCCRATFFGVVFWKMTQNTPTYFGVTRYNHSDRPKSKREFLFPYGASKHHYSQVRPTQVDASKHPELVEIIPRSSSNNQYPSIYVYTYIERERDIHPYPYIYLHTYMYLDMQGLNPK